MRAPNFGKGNYGTSASYPGGPPPPAYPQGPTGGMQPGYYPQPPQQESSTWKYVLIGCGVVFLIGALAVGGTCYYTVKKGGELVTMGLKMQKQQFVQMLSPDHSDDEKARFEEDYDRLADEYDRLGLVQWSEQYGEVMDKLTMISADRTISVEESESWCEDMEKTLYGDTSGDSGNEEEDY